VSEMQSPEGVRIRPGRTSETDARKVGPNVHYQLDEI
jgi:hypothetical protein